ncbi:glycosyltransferase [Edaphobacter modestus]|uniref:Glycosyl transferase family 2 n=1 Tax=Edaphobacter modestus TaxID=388466 RepID=A0A4Q7YR62_9BACT|nr:glycosyltransferase family A protein [Edaphobacter modestus]RZU39960.1 glycosyl transferase family 2 [Edaphobacter modestus]
MERYVLMTAAHNEAKLIGATIETVLAQTALPSLWVIVSDRSTDDTDNIVKEYCAKHSFMRLIRLNKNSDRGTIAKVNALMAASNEILSCDHDYVGNLDADVSFDNEYFERLLSCFQLNPSLGIAGGLIYEKRGASFRPRVSNSISSVAHAAQLVRRQCYSEIGGYIALEYGGEDWYAEIRARSKGWHVRALPELKVMHHRVTGGADSLLRHRFREGKMDFSVGSHPAFELVKCARRFPEHPACVGTIARLAGFFSSYFNSELPLVPPEIVDFLRKEQMNKVRTFIYRQ